MPIRRYSLQDLNDTLRNKHLSANTISQILSSLKQQKIKIPSDLIAIAKERVNLRTPGHENETNKEGKASYELILEYIKLQHTLATSATEVELQIGNQIQVLFEYPPRYFTGYIVDKTPKKIQVVFTYDGECTWHSLSTIIYKFVALRPVVDKFIYVPSSDRTFYIPKDHTKAIKILEGEKTCLPQEPAQTPPLVTSATTVLTSPYTGPVSTPSAQLFNLSAIAQTISPANGPAVIGSAIVAATTTSAALVDSGDIEFTVIQEAKRLAAKNTHVADTLEHRRNQRTKLGKELTTELEAHLKTLDECVDQAKGIKELVEALILYSPDAPSIDKAFAEYSKLFPKELQPQLTQFKQKVLALCAQIKKSLSIIEDVMAMCAPSVVPSLSLASSSAAAAANHHLPTALTTKQVIESAGAKHTQSQLRAYQLNRSKTPDSNWDAGSLASLQATTSGPFGVDWSNYEYLSSSEDDRSDDGEERNRSKKARLTNPPEL